MQLRFKGAAAGPLARRQRLVEDGHCAVDVARPGLGLGEDNFEESVEEQDVLFSSKFHATAHGLEPTAGFAALSARHGVKKDLIGLPHRQIVLAGNLSSYSPSPRPRCQTPTSIAAPHMASRDIRARG